VSTGADLVTFSREQEPALRLVPVPNGLWTTTWTPLEAVSSLSLSIVIQNENGASGTLAATGRVTAPRP
jgi:hypothetical protein